MDFYHPDIVDDDSIISRTEMILDQLYNKSKEVQKKITIRDEKKGFTKRIKQLIKLEDIQK